MFVVQSMLLTQELDLTKCDEDILQIKTYLIIHGHTFGRKGPN
jgi:hypothetical protein